MGGSAGSQAAGGPVGLAGRRRTQSPVLHLALATTEKSRHGQLLLCLVNRLNRPVLENDDRPGGLAAGSDQRSYASGSFAEHLTARSMRLPWLLKNKGYHRKNKIKRQEREGMSVAVRRAASRHPTGQLHQKPRLVRKGAGRTATLRHRCQARVACFTSAARAVLRATPRAVGHLARAVANVAAAHSVTAVSCRY